MTYGSLFSGIGGLDLALEAFGHVPVWQAECDPYARKVLAKHWPTVRRYNDVKEIDDAAERPDIICGGFPCQDISPAGKRAGINGPRSGLWSEFARIIRVLRPRVVFVENSVALADRGLDRVLGDLAALGFDAQWGVLGACAVGRPHTRDRMFVLAYTNGLPGERWIRTWATGQRTVQARIDREMPAVVRLESDRELQRMADGIPREVERLRAIGNSAVWQQAALALEGLTARAFVRQECAS